MGEGGENNALGDVPLGEEVGFGDVGRGEVGDRGGDRGERENREEWREEGEGGSDLDVAGDPLALPICSACAASAAIVACRCWSLRPSTSMYSCATCSLADINSVLSSSFSRSTCFVFFWRGGFADTRAAQAA